MNRRIFIASLGALAGAATTPFATLRAAIAPAAMTTVPPTTYAWAHLIVRAQAKANPAMLARHLNLSPSAADHLFQQLIKDGVLRAPGAAGIARAVVPIESGAKSSAGSGLSRRLSKAWQTLRTEEADPPLVIQDDTALGCAQSTTEDAPDASTDEPIQESSRRG